MLALEFYGILFRYELYLEQVVSLSSELAAKTRTRRVVKKHVHPVQYWSVAVWWTTVLDMDIMAFSCISNLMCCINIFGFLESGSDSEEGSESSSGSEEDEDESKSESEASTKTGTYFFSPRLLFLKSTKALSVVCVKTASSRYV